MATSPTPRWGSRGTEQGAGGCVGAGALPGHRSLPESPSRCPSCLSPPAPVHGIPGPATARPPGAAVPGVPVSMGLRAAWWSSPHCVRAHVPKTEAVRDVPRWGSALGSASPILPRARARQRQHHWVAQPQPQHHQVAQPQHRRVAQPQPQALPGRCRIPGCSPCRPVTVAAGAEVWPRSPRAAARDSGCASPGPGQDRALHAAPWCRAFGCVVPPHLPQADPRRVPQILRASPLLGPGSITPQGLQCSTIPAGAIITWLEEIPRGDSSRKNVAWWILAS